MNIFEVYTGNKLCLNLCSLSTLSVISSINLSRLRLLNKLYNVFQDLSRQNRLVKIPFWTGHSGAQSLRPQTLHYTPATKLGGGILDSPCLCVRLSVCPSVCLLPFRVRPVASTVQDGFFPYLVQMINSMRGCVACDDLWPWPISSRSFGLDLENRVRSVASTVLDGFFLYLAQMITIIRGCVACYVFFFTWDPWCQNLGGPLDHWYLLGACRFIFDRAHICFTVNWWPKLSPKHHKSNGSWCIGIKGEMSGTGCVTFTWDIYIYMSCL